MFFWGFIMKNQLIKITLFLSAFSLAMPFATASSQTQSATKSMESDTKKPYFSILNNAKNHISRNWTKYSNGLLIAGLATGTIFFIKERNKYNQLNNEKNNILVDRDGILKKFELFEADVMDTIMKNLKFRKIDEANAELSSKELLLKKDKSFIDQVRYKAYRKYQRSLKQDSNVPETN